jgi:hypothetical protein
MKLVKQDYQYLLESSLAIAVAASMIVYGMGKPTQFTSTIILNKPVSALTGMELMWAFYGYSKIYPIIIGLFEILGGLLLLFKKSRIAGVVIITTILVNVIAQDVFYGVNQGALKAAIIYQLMITAIGWFNRKSLMATIKFYLQQINGNMPGLKWYLLSTISLLLAFVFKVVEYFITH